MKRTVATLLLIASAGVVGAQDLAPPAALPEALTIWLYPDNLQGRRGHQLDLASITVNAQAVSAVLTMYGNGQDGCRLRGRTALGTLEGTRLVLKTQVDAGDNLTCPMNLELHWQTSDSFKGRFTNGQYAGEVKLQ